MARDVVKRLRSDLHYAGAAPVVVNNKDLSDLLALAEAAKEYHKIQKADPTSLDLPPAGSRFDKALARLYAGSSGEESA